MLSGVASWSLQKKVSVTLLGVMTTLVLLTYLILNAIISPAFDRLEMTVTRNLIRAAAIHSDIHVPTPPCATGRPDDTYAFAREVPASPTWTCSPWPS
jgi:hypothetical protein